MLKRIHVQQLTLGMHIDGFCGPWMEHPFWRNHFVLTDPQDIALILASSIQEVWIDTSKGKDLAADTPALAQTESLAAVQQEVHAAEAVPSDTQPTSLAAEYKRAAEICVKSKRAIMTMLQEARMGKTVDTELASHMVQEISDSMLRNHEAMINLARLKTADDYTYMHSVAVCALMVALARRLELDEAQTRSMGLAGLLHDLGKAMMPMEVLNKPGKLTDAEFAIIQSHPAQGHKLLVEGQVLDPIVLDVVLHHHEKTDGTGYPQRQKDEEISLYAKMGAVCDVYDAITSNRPYKKGWDPAESLKRMAEWTNGHLDAQVFQAFVKSLGIYPTGSLVRLTSGRIGVVVEQNAATLLKPLVKVFFSTKADMRIPPQVIDLAATGCKEKIIGREDPETWRFPDLNELWSGMAPLA
ncbi:HD-GYP domain-containing protein [Rhodoferax sp. OV413]|uniref:HD-GYP domain-containing protein n=1 Tax=Rhodoferax sp. OV413 TaxID=1855285 RepID=UPI000B85849B|nr:HD-GYP domain-containing protein [Rhodoferax sp. OV413]